MNDENLLLDLVQKHPLVAVGAGAVVGLYIIGLFAPDEDDKRVIPKFNSSEDEIAWLEERLRILRELRENKPSRDEAVEQLRILVDEVRKLQADVDEMKNKAQE